MKKLTKILTATALSATILGASVGVMTSCSQKPIIGVIQFGTHASLNNCYEGIKLGLQEAGIDVEKDYKIEFVNDNFDADASTSHATALVNKGAKVIIGIATPSAMAAANKADGNIPVVYCAVTDGSNLDNYENVCGSSDRPNYEVTLDMVTKVMGKEDLKIGVLSYSGEDSDPIMISDMRAAAQTYNGMEIDVKTVTEITTVTTSAQALVSDNVDCVVNLLDNTIVGQLDNLFPVFNEANIPVFGSEVEQAVGTGYKNGACVAAASIDYIEVGKISGKMAGQILKGEKTAEQLGQQLVQEPTLYYNPTQFERFNLTKPESLTMISTADYVAAKS